jgi:hypothetical protein
MNGYSMKLYRSTRDANWWFAFDPTVGWVMFRAEAGGWQNLRRATGFEPTEMREVPLCMGFNTGIPGAPTTADRASDLVRAAAGTKKRRIRSAASPTT